MAVTASPISLKISPQTASPGVESPIPTRYIRQVLAQYARANTRKGATLAAVDVVTYLAGLAAVLWLPALWEKIGASILVGVTIVNLFALGHEAAHGALVRQRWLNRWLAIVCFAPGLINYRLWVGDHNGLHHMRANVKDGGNSWTPLTKTEYDALPAYRRWLNRVYRSSFGLGLGLGYFIERWQKVDFVPRAATPVRLRASAWRHFAGLCAYLAILVGGLIAAPRFAPIGAVEAVILGLMVPFTIWMTTIGFAVLVQHTHPDVPWTDGLPEGRVPAADLVTTQWLFPKWFTHLSHNSMDHIVHHWNPRVPCYNLGAASERLRELLGDRLVRERFTLARLNVMLRSCRLYDYQNQQWLDFDGRPTTQRLAGRLTDRTDASDMSLQSRAAS